MKKIIVLVALSITGYTFSQQLPQYSQYLRNQYMVNPGAAGVYDFVDVTLSGRLQWLGFENAPKTSYLSVTSPISRTKKPRYNPSLRISNGPVRNPEIKTGKLKHAIGGQVIIDQYGAFRKLYFGGTYALHIPVSKNYNLSLGTRLGMSNNTFIKDRAVTLTPELDNTYQSYVAGGLNRYMMDLGFGLYFYSKNMFLGVAADDVTRDLVTFGNGTPNFNTQIHYTATAGWKIPVSENITLTPAVLAKYMAPAPVSFEGTLQIEYKEWLWAGVSYRHTDAVVGMVGLNINEMFKFGYSYDFNVSRFNKYSAGGHELVLGIMLGR